MKTRWTVAFAAALVCCGCASTSYIPPVSTYHETTADDLADAIRYRTLTRDDFKATKPPGGGKIPVHASAALVGSVRLDPDAEWVFSSIKQGDVSMVEATINKLRFIAIMKPNESWWNQDLDSSLTAYVLAHEQIHFAIFELEARSMNARIDEIAAQVRSVAATIEEAQQASESRLNEIRRASDKKMQERQNDYERETANGKLRHRQEEWETRIRLELANTAWSR